MRRVYKNLCPATILVSVMAANVWKNCLKNVESNNNKILYETLLDFFLQRNGLTFWISLVACIPVLQFQVVNINQLIRKFSFFRANIFFNIILIRYKVHEIYVWLWKAVNFSWQFQYPLWVPLTYTVCCIKLLTSPCNGTTNKFPTLMWHNLRKVIQNFNIRVDRPAQ